MRSTLLNLATSTLAATWALTTPAIAAPDGDLYFVNMTGEAVTLTVDGHQDGPAQSSQVIGRSIARGEHDLHIGVGADRSINLRVNFEMQSVAQDRYGRTYWCVVAGKVGDTGQLRVLQLDAAQCSKIVAMGNRPPP